MITTRQTRTALSATASLAQIRGMLLWPFTHRFASPIWFAVRLYLANIWFWMGFGKLEGGYLTSDPTADLFKAILAGHLPVPVPAYKGFVQLMLDLGVTQMLSFSMPFLEMAVALAFISGVMIVPAAIGGTFLVINVLLSGMGTLAFDGKVIALQVLLVLAFRVSDYIGFQRLAMRILRAIIRKVRPAARAQSAA